MIAGFREFEFDLPDALLTSMISALDAMETASLLSENVELIPDAQGVYQLILNGEIVYIGKTDSEAGLRKRLGRHAWTIQHRTGLSTGDVHFKAVRVFVFTAIDLETQLIRHYKGSSSISWNNSGFGSNDPGRNRDLTRAKANSFDSLYPINLDEVVSMGISGELPITTVIQTLRKVLPYTLRIQNSAVHPDFDGRTVVLSDHPISTRDAITAVVALLPTGWQATALAGRIILYKENQDAYPAARIIARS